MTTYQATEAKDIKVGDELLAEYFDANGMAASDHLPVTAVKAFARKVRITCPGWGTYTYPLTHLLPVVVKPAGAHLFTEDEYRLEAISE